MKKRELLNTKPKRAAAWLLLVVVTWIVLRVGIFWVRSFDRHTWGELILAGLALFVATMLIFSEGDDD